MQHATKYGGIAQLGERLNGIQEVAGSNPAISTILNKKSRGFTIKTPAFSNFSEILLFVLTPF